MPAFTAPGGSFNAIGLPAMDPDEVNFVREPLFFPAQPYFGSYRTGTPFSAARDRDLDVASMSVDYAAPDFDVKLITSYTFDESSGNPYVGIPILTLIQGYWGGYVPQLPNWADINSFRYESDRESYTGELRITSNGTGRLDWVAGVFYREATTETEQRVYEFVDEITPLMRGVSEDRFAFYPIPPSSVDYAAGFRDQKDVETSKAVFGEASYDLTHRLTATLGVRYAKEGYEYDAAHWGFLVGAAVPTLDNGLLTTGTITNDPVTYKAGLSYSLSKDNILYGTVSTGFRIGGINSAVPKTPNCQAALTLLGGAEPKEYEEDVVTNYEVGAKLRLLDGRAQLNIGAFQIDWEDIQLTQSLPGCVFAFVQNAGTARSRGVDLQAEAWLTESLKIDLNASYTDAEYTKTTLAPPTPEGNRAIVVGKGDTFLIPPWSVAVGLEYNWTLANRPVFARFDYSYTSDYYRTPGFGRAAYNPDTRDAVATNLVDFRAGVVLDHFEISAFVKNLLNSDDILTRTGGRTGCTTEECTTFVSQDRTTTVTSFPPRTFGLSITYRN